MALCGIVLGQPRQKRVIQGLLQPWKSSCCSGLYTLCHATKTKPLLHQGRPIVSIFATVSHDNGIRALRNNWCIQEHAPVSRPFPCLSYPKCQTSPANQASWPHGSIYHSWWQGHQPLLDLSLPMLAIESDRPKSSWGSSGPWRVHLHQLVFEQKRDHGGGSSRGLRSGEDSSPIVITLLLYSIFFL